MFHDTIVTRRDQSRLVLFDFIKWPEDMLDWKGYISKWSAYLLNPPRLIIFFE